MVVFRIVDVRPLPQYRVWVRFQGGEEGEIDLAHLADKGVFSVWSDAGAFASVSIDALGNLVWEPDIELCADALYFRLTGKTPAETWGSKATRESA
jgi:hypothetical protein